MRGGWCSPAAAAGGVVLAVGEEHPSGGAENFSTLISLVIMFRLRI